MSRDIFQGYIKKHDFLICADSDGCVMDVMNIKHEKCFAPCFVEAFELQERSEEAINKWLKINLYSKTRGINRFKGCLQALTDLNIKPNGFETFKKFCENSPELSNRALEIALANDNNQCMQKVLEWSIATNKAIVALSEQVNNKPFPGAKEALHTASRLCDIAGVSSANRIALESEWEEHGLTSFINILLSQEAGSKAYCIASLLEKGYSSKKVIMIGDAVGDINAALENGVWFYPIIIGSEAGSWKRFQYEVLNLLIEEKITEELQQQWLNEFYSSLGI